MIDLEFSGKSKRDTQVRQRWKEYLDHLKNLGQDPEQQKEQLLIWTQRKYELLANLLYEMGVAVGYPFDKVEIMRGIYAPIGHANWEFETHAVRRLLLEILAGHRALPMDVRSLPAVEAPPAASATANLPAIQSNQ